jgi:hypothetical protein
MSEVIATAEFQGARLSEIEAAANEAFFDLTGRSRDFNARYEIVVGPAEISEILATTADRTVVRLWSAECHLVSKETAT